MNNPQLIQIGALAKLTGVTIQTLRYYERRNLFKPKTKKASGFRVYSISDITTVHFIKHAQFLGFSLNEIKDLLLLRSGEGNNCPQTSQSITKKLQTITERIDQLSIIQQKLKALLQVCSQNQAPLACPIIKSLDLE